VEMLEGWWWHAEPPFKFVDNEYTHGLSTQSLVFIDRNDTGCNRAIDDEAPPTTKDVKSIRMVSSFASYLAATLAGHRPLPLR